MNEDTRQYASLYNVHPNDVVTVIKISRLVNQLLAVLPRSQTILYLSDSDLVGILVVSYDSAEQSRIRVTYTNISCTAAMSSSL